MQFEFPYHERTNCIAPCLQCRRMGKRSSIGTRCSMRCWGRPQIMMIFRYRAQIYRLLSIPPSEHADSRQGIPQFVFTTEIAQRMTLWSFVSGPATPILPTPFEICISRLQLSGAFGTARKVKKTMMSERMSFQVMLAPSYGQPGTMFVLHLHLYLISTVTSTTSRVHQGSGAPRRMPLTGAVMNDSQCQSSLLRNQAALYMLRIFNYPPMLANYSLTVSSLLLGTTGPEGETVSANASKFLLTGVEMQDLCG